MLTPFILHKPKYFFMFLVDWFRWDLLRPTDTTEQMPTYIFALEQKQISSVELSILFSM
jgi:hypothetical protein